MSSPNVRKLVFVPAFIGIALLQGCRRNVDARGEAEAAMAPYVEAAVQLISVAFAESGEDIRKYNPDCFLDPYEGRRIGPFYRLVRAHAVASAAMAVRTAHGSRHSLSDADIQGILEASRGFAERVAERLKAETSCGKAVAALQKVAAQPAAFPHRDTVQDWIRELCFGERAALAKKSTELGFWPLDSLTLVPIMVCEVAFCAGKLDKGDSDEPWGVRDFVRTPSPMWAPGNYRNAWRDLGRIVAPAAFEACRESAQHHGLDQWFVKPMPAIGEGERSAPDVSLSVARGASIRETASFRHTKSISASSMYCGTEFFTPAFLECDADFAGWKGPVVRFDLTIKATADAPLGKHYFVMYHDGAYVSDGKDHPVSSKRVVEIVVTDKKD